MGIRGAILKAADHIGANPDLFRYFNIRVPGNCGTPGCALGWIGFFGNAVPAGEDWRSISYVARDLSEHSACKAPPLMSISSTEFYCRMALLQPGWTQNPEKCASGLRLYADKYHPAPVTAPDWETIATPDAHTFEATV